MEKGLFYGFLAIGLVIGGVAGVFIGGELASNEPHPREAPLPPPEMNESSALRYAENLEQTRVHNRILNNTSPDQVEIGCNSRSVASSSRSQYVFVQCGATRYDDGSVSDTIPNTVIYRIREAGDSRVERRSKQATAIQPNATSTQEFQSVPLSIYNFGEDEKEFNISATVLNSSTGTPRAEYRVSLKPERGAVLDTVFTAPGTYQIQVQTSESTVDATWTLDTDRQRLVILAGPDGLRIEETRSP